MKSWLTRLRISNAVDSGNPLSTSSKEVISRSGDLRAFEQKVAALDCALKNSRPKFQTPPALHTSIMQAVRTADRPVLAARPVSVLRSLAAPAFALLLASALWLTWRHHPTQTPSPVSVVEARTLAAAATAFEMRGEIARAAPVLVTAPLSNELDNLHRDLKSTAQFLLASIPEI